MCNTISYENENSFFSSAISAVKERTANLALKYYIETYGCQMNEHDSEKLAGMLRECGYTKAELKQEADLILFNTCCVREHAEKRTFGNVGFIKELKTENPRLILGVCGCMMQQKDVAKRLFDRFPFVDLVFGTHELKNFPEMLLKVLDEKRVFQISDSDGEVIEGLPVERVEGFSTFVNIMYGCNNFCTYCIVPYVRGRERSRRAEDIVNEVKDVVASGYKEITLLGQNVNSYSSDGLDFPALLRLICREVTELKRLRFMTSHPKDLSDGLILAMSELNNLCKHIHLPVQSGSDRILKAMNRKYTSSAYLELVDKLRAKVPHVEITTDIIVGFPGESEEDFEATCELVRKVGYSNAYTFAYSPRGGTVAARMDEQIPEEEKKRRLNALNAVLAETIPSNNDKYIGFEGEILVEGVDHRGEPLLFGKLSNFKMVYVEGDESLIGSFVPVKVDGYRFNSLFGHIVDR
ncbi:MAG: tRNA (N6-isopentenyl adenosine(37)-C2)-methylthiotransferase MiaB [Clostridia bacterium]|nr:tRNA (N6-isopentenyl adenosine(37)-C2)-methylthiotransferase MiaB [Clostridia bacterium]